MCGEMLRTFSTLLFGLASAGALALAQPGASPQRRAVALTFDDFPYVHVGGGSYLTNAQRGTSELLRVLQAHRVPAEQVLAGRGYEIMPHTIENSDFTMLGHVSKRKVL
jgi:peptidoglycan/xylan/chitin deacetylase (PgdA/CDA1 family)